MSLVGPALRLTRAAVLLPWRVAGHAASHVRRRDDAGQPGASASADLPDTPLAGAYAHDRAAAPMAPVAPVPSAPAPVTPIAPLEGLGEDPPTPVEPDELVATSADDPTDDTPPGAVVRVDEPWAGYRTATAPDVVERLAGADAATATAVRLYEAAHRKRKTVLAAADDRLAEVS